MKEVAAAIPDPNHYEISRNGFLPDELPLQSLPDPYYAPWESIISNFQLLLQSDNLRTSIKHMPTLGTSKLKRKEEWRRAYVLLAFMTHGYIWGGQKPSEVCFPSFHEISCLPDNRLEAAIANLYPILRNIELS